MMVSALFVIHNGVYFNLPDVDPWSLKRDAMRYNGPNPVVAHPPCQLWGAMAKVNYARWGGEHNRPGNDCGLFAHALQVVNRWGGVLEHPAKSYAWPGHGIARPVPSQWTPTGQGWTCEVWQSAYGHRANKATWLYYSGSHPPFNLDWTRPIGTHQIGYPDQRGKARNKPVLPKRERISTPIAFRDMLIKLAQHSKGERSIDES